MAVLGRIAGTEHFRNIERYPATTASGLLLVRVDGDLFFGNVEAVGERLEDALADCPSARHLVLVLSAVNAIDTSALFALRDWNQMLRQRGIGLHLAEVKGPVMDRLRNSDLFGQLNGKVFLSTAMAWEALGGDAPAPHC
jgi:SulP family sulfate permease